MTTLNKRNSVLTPAARDLSALFARSLVDGAVVWERSSGNITPELSIDSRAFWGSCGDAYFGTLDNPLDRLSFVHEAAGRVVAVFQSGRILGIEEDAAKWSAEAPEIEWIEARGFYLWIKSTSGEFHTFHLMGGPLAVFPSYGLEPLGLQSIGNLIGTPLAGGVAVLTPLGDEFWASEAPVSVQFPNDDLLLAPDSFERIRADALTGETLASIDAVDLGEIAETFPDGTLRARGESIPDRIIGTDLTIQEERDRAEVYPWYRSPLSISGGSLAYRPGTEGIVGAWLEDIELESPLLLLPPAPWSPNQKRAKLGSDEQFETVLKTASGTLAYNVTTELDPEIGNQTAIAIVKATGETTFVPIPSNGQTFLNVGTLTDDGSTVVVG